MRILALTSILTTLAILAAACGDNAATDSATVDIDKLDAGNYPTTPIDIETTRTPMSAVARESIKIGKATPLPVDYDGRFRFAPLHPARVNRVTPEEPPYFEGTKIEKSQFAAEIPGLIAGWRASANRRDELGRGRSIETFTLRFGDSNLARNAATKLLERTPGDPFEGVSGRPDAQSKITQTDALGVTALRTFLVQNDMLLYIQIYDPLSRPFDPVDNAGITKSYLDKQLIMLREYSPTPTAELERLPLDNEGLLSKTLPRDKPLSGAAVYPAHAALFLSERPAALSAAFADANVDYVAVNGATVYRAADEAAAKRLMAAMENGAFNQTGLVDVEAPANLTVAHCYDLDPNLDVSGLNSTRCLVSVGRYVASVSGNNIQDVRQRIAAQYKLLATAG
ncbi:hypothetical protein ACFVAV_20060 [Nocardia sp. NPDC057663]|uniref:DUF7373 family lipoprotein n=1 Tax=Nocardia sp. NPDC057663 TaxID=3346201 RepID=UPI0036715D61